VTDKPICLRFEMDLSRFNSALQKIGKAASDEALARTASAGAHVFEAHAKINAEEQFTKNPTGFLKGSIGVGQITSGGYHAEAEWGSYGCIYAKIHEFGGIINAINGPYLVFMTDDGLWHSVPLVDIPAQPYIRPAQNQNQEEARRAMLTVLVGEIHKAGVYNAGGMIV
jgi:HK97 gp10 family phage protein